MSHKTYDRQLRNTQTYLSATLQLEPSQADIRENRQLLAILYVRYIVIANRLGDCLDQMVQPQKLLLIRKILEATLGRILELKADLVEADLNEYTHFGDVLEALRLIPEQVELKVPEYFRRIREDELMQRQNDMDAILEKYGCVSKEPPKKRLSEHQAILIIQKHERARQARLKAQYIRDLRNAKEKVKPEESAGQSDKTGLSIHGAMLIQRVWRGIIARRETKRRKYEEMVLIGMLPAPNREPSEEILKDQETKNYRRQLQRLEWKKYVDAIVECKDDLEKHQREVILEQLSDQMRSWLNEYKTQTGKIPEYTGQERLSSRTLLSRQGTESEISKSTVGSAKDQKTKKDKIKKNKEAKNILKIEDEDEMSTKATLSTFVPELQMRKDEYDEKWFNKDETNNFKQTHYKDIIVQEQTNELEMELREIVDEMMKNELLLLQDACDRDRGHKPRKKASKKQRKTSKKSKKKKEKDLTPDRTIESLFEELVANGIIKKFPETYFTNFIAEKSYSNPVPYNKGKDPAIALGDLRQILTEYCCIPLLTEQLHNATPHIKSILISGSKKSGKNMLLHAICHETGALLFDLTPANIAGKYPGKSGLTMLVHLVIKVARIMQPSIIFMDNAERPFVKKIPKTDKTDPKRLRKDLPKMVKNFSPEDRIILIGLSHCPWEADQKLLQQVYQKLVYLPKPNYSTRFCFWTHLVKQYDAIGWKFDVSLMSKISDGYSLGAIIACFHEVMTVKRVLQLRIHPLSPYELINALCKQHVIYREEEEALLNWWLKTPMSRRRLRAIEILEQEEYEIQAKKANAKKK